MGLLPGKCALGGSDNGARSLITCQLQQEVKASLRTAGLTSPKKRIWVWAASATESRGARLKSLHQLQPDLRRLSLGANMSHCCYSPTIVTTTKSSANPSRTDLEEGTLPAGKRKAAHKHTSKTVPCKNGKALHRIQTFSMDLVIF